MAKYKYNMKVKKIIYMSEEMITVIAENEAEAKKLAEKAAAGWPGFEKEKTEYITEVYSYSCNPVSDNLS